MLIALIYLCILFYFVEVLVSYVAVELGVCKEGNFVLSSVLKQPWIALLLGYVPFSVIFYFSPELGDFGLVTVSILLGALMRTAVINVYIFVGQWRNKNGRNR